MYGVENYVVMIDASTEFLTMWKNIKIKCFVKITLYKSKLWYDSNLLGR